MYRLLLSAALLFFAACSAERSGETQAPTVSGSEKPTRLIVDSDANNELDDQHAIAYALLSRGPLQVEGITVNRTDNGGDIEAQAEEARRIVRLTGLADEVPVLEGASGSYREIAPNVDEQTFDGAEAVNFLIEQAHASGERPLVIVPIGKLTNLALALEKDPSVASEIRIVWLGSNFPDSGEYNLENDPSAVNPVMAGLAAAALFDESAELSDPPFPLASFLSNRLGKPENRGQRRANLVVHVREKRRLHPIGSLGLLLRNYLRTQWGSESERIFASQGARSSCILCDTAMQRNAARRKCSRSEPQRCFEIVP